MTSPQPSPEVIALKSTIDRLTKQLKKIKREKNLAADLLDRRADDHEKEMKLQREKHQAVLQEHQKAMTAQEAKYLQVAKIHEREMRECEKRCEELSASNLEMAERLKEMEEEMVAAKEVIDILQQQNLGTSVFASITTLFRL